jgi:hypothetical protein
MKDSGPGRRVPNECNSNLTSGYIYISRPSIQQMALSKLERETQLAREKSPE